MGLTARVQTARYALAELTIVSALALALLPRVARGPSRAALTVTARARPRSPRAIRRWQHRWTDEGGQVVMALARGPRGFVLRFPRVCDFAISADGAQVRALPHRELSPAALERLLVDQVLPRCLGHRGELLVHAAGIGFEHGTVLFVGEAGHGKSTLAALFRREGRALLSDDCLLLRVTRDAVVAVPSYPGLRLRPDSLRVLREADRAAAARSDDRGKHRVAVAPSPLPASRRRVVALYFLGDPSARARRVSIEPLSNAAACVRLLLQSFQLDPSAPEAAAGALARASAVLANVPVFALDYPRDYRVAPELLATLSRHVRRLAGVTGRIAARAARR